ncbi:DUF447 domain-containing protein [Novipirellula artificiosorum]|uniref:DUF447 family protein n=1 Tax=Novipirellula artificiosorum TaxID=2528016 RepID=A0A5C6DPV3_9BACT|nr:DUF447 domain-containing protein [Novipirellula artificiosorum]TWU37046.1 hypothetical protein Poly41_31720 [Novipirellula artificiosorum]
MILESIVTTADQDNQVNLAPMGIDVSDALAIQDPIGQTMVLRPFRTSKTFSNLCHQRRAVVHVSDDVDLFARGAIHQERDQTTLQSLVHPVGDGLWALHDCHRWFAVEITSSNTLSTRASFECRVLQSEVIRPFFGFNRAKHATIEAAILATRIQLLPREEIECHMQRLKPLIEKTAGEHERNAFSRLADYIESHLAASTLRS